jgi:hypothetical protein
VWVAVLGGRVELLRWLLRQPGAAAERRVQRSGITPLMYAREAGQAESVRLLEEWNGHTGRVKVRPSRVEGGAVVMATTQRYGAVVLADGVLRTARPWSAEQPVGPRLTARIARLACGRDCIAVMTAAGRVMAA